MGNVLVLGNGKQGNIIAKDLREAGHDAKTMDNSFPANDETNIAADVTRLAGPELKGFDAIVNALPSKISYSITNHICLLQDIYDLDIPVIDVSFSAEEYADHVKSARNITIPDCGLAPGIPDLFVGRALRSKGTLEDVDIYVGGIAQDLAHTFGYVITWSLPCLKEEYTRYARYVRNHELKTSHPLKDKPLRVSFLAPERLILEAIRTDGLRTLLPYGDRIKNLSEYTLRWPGHIKHMKDLILTDTFEETMLKHCSEGKDMVIEKVVIDGETVLDLFVKEKDNIKAMTLTTAYTCSAFVQAALKGLIKGSGVISPVEVGMNHPEASDFIISYLKRRNILKESVSLQ